MTSQRFALVAPSLEGALDLRGALLADIHKKNHRILCVAPRAATTEQAVKLVGRFANIGVEYRPISYDTPGLNYLNRYRVTKTLKEILQDWQPDCVLGYGANALTFSAAAAKRAGVRRVVSLCNELPDFLKPIVEDGGQPTRAAFRRALGLSDCVIFHNSDHPRAIQEQQLMAADKKVVVVAGRGVDVETQDVADLPDLSDGLVFVMVSRFDAVRGVLDFVQAARRVSGHAKSAKFVLAGQPGRDDINLAALGFKGPQFEVIAGDVDLRTVLSRGHVCVHPSHAEGMPPAVLEALALGRPIITTDGPGCRETVDETVNGYLVQRGDVGALTAAMDALLKRPDLIPAMARASRLKAERRFDVRQVNAALIDALGL